jgi:hypothetical protein
MLKLNIQAFLIRIFFNIQENVAKVPTFFSKFRLWSPTLQRFFLISHPSFDNLRFQNATLHQNRPTSG